MRFANTLVFGFALRNKEEWKKGHSGGPQKCVLYCFPNEEMASEAAGKCDCTLGYILYHSCRVGVGGTIIGELLRTCLGTTSSVCWWHTLWRTFQMMIMTEIAT